MSEQFFDSGRYDPLSELDHRALCRDLQVDIAGDTSAFIRGRLDDDRMMNRPVFTTFIDVSNNFIRDFTSDDPLDLTSERASSYVFNSGVVLAVATLEKMCEAFEIDIDEFYSLWYESGVAVIKDFKSGQVEKTNLKRAINEIREGIEYDGMAAFEALPDEYVELVIKSEEGYAEVSDHITMYRTGFGFVMKSGYIALAYAYERKMAGELDFSKLFDVSEPYNTQPEKRTHATMAGKFMRLIESDDEGKGAAVVLGNVYQDNIYADERLFEVVHAFAYAVYGDEVEKGGDIGDTGESFMYGMHLGLHIMTDIAEDMTDEANVIERWVGTRLHRELAKNGPDFEENTRSETHDALQKIIDTTSIPVEYAELLDLIEEKMKHDLEDSAAFRNGFQYAINTFTRKLEVEMKSTARKVIRKEFVQFHADLENYIEKDNLTLQLHGVFQQYLDHCSKLGYDPNLLTEDQASHVLDRMKGGIKTLVEGIDKLEVNGNSLLYLREPGADEGECVLLRRGDKMVADIYGVTLAPSPIDSSYFTLDPATGAELKLQMMPTLVLRSAEYRAADGTSHAEYNDVMVGVAVPGTVYRAVSD